MKGGFAVPYVRQTDRERNENDHYATAPWVTYALMRTEHKNIPNTVWEPAAGRGWMAEEIEKHGYKVEATDLYEYENARYPITRKVDFLKTYCSEDMGIDKAVITNPPYAKNMAEAFIRHSVQTLEAPYTAVLCRLAFMESQTRCKMFKEIPPSRVYVLSSRFSADETQFVDKPEGGMIPYAWFVWDYQNGNSLRTDLEWIDGKAMVAEWMKREEKNGSSSAVAGTSRTLTF